MGKTVVAKIVIRNLPEHEVEGYVVVRKDGTDLWYYGVYDTRERAQGIAEKLGNGLVLEAIWD